MKLDYFTVCHQPTGRKVSDNLEFKTVAEAVKFTIELSKVSDFSFIDPGELAKEKLEEIKEFISSWNKSNGKN